MNEPYDVRWTPPYMLGTYLAVNAIPDAALVVDGPDCSVPKAEQVHGNHDWHSTLLSADRVHRILTTGATVTTVTADRRPEIAAALRTAAGRDDVGVVLLGALAMAYITDPPYDEIGAHVAAETGALVVELPRRSLVADWLAGYADTLAALAAALPLPAPAADRDPRKVALVGYLMDRTEEDHQGNLRELRRLLAAIGLDVVSVWLDGSPVAALARVAEAGTIVSLPYAREAATRLAARTGAALVETALPLGLEGTTAWLRAVAAAAGGAQPEPLIAAELAVAAPKLEWVVPFLFLNRAVGFLGDPHLLRGFVGLMHELGARVPYRVLWCKADHPHADLAADPLDDPLLLVDPRSRDPGEAFRQLQAAGRDLRLLVGSSTALQSVSPEDCAVSELGFPSFHSHALFDRPFLGYRGCLCLVDRLAEAMRLHESRAATGR